ncbi:LOB domain-containing protein 37-like [Juglans microcarpa x Juglans regia]|uniref:LOB domain-containing protein 37-like n=1 Tax=Juglans microcarpa x Juglans regia TaxID=2249226 RepID=UPI001B7F426A|nr:LOB domain-containing protein 37-like [Juglans microcarpa x Juglans regia]
MVALVFILSLSSLALLLLHDKAIRGRKKEKMSCNGCRVLRKGCSETCVLRSCLQWIESPTAQGNAVLLLAKFFGRSDLLSFVSAVPESDRPALFQSLLYEACGRTVNPVDGAVGLLSRGMWHVCQLAVETALAGGTLTPITDITSAGISTDASGNDESSVQSLFRPSVQRMQENQPSNPLTLSLQPRFSSEIGSTVPRLPAPWRVKRSMDMMISFKSEMTSLASSGNDRKLLNLFD